MIAILLLRGGYVMFCVRCGAKLKGNERNCPVCGNFVNPNIGFKQGNQSQNFQQNVTQEQFNNTQYGNNLYNSNKDDINDNKLMAVLSYIGILVLVPIFAAKDSPYARFHANQGLVLLISEVAVSIFTFIVKSVLNNISWLLSSAVVGLLSLANILFLMAAVLGIIYAVQGKFKELPLIGSFKILN